MLIVNDLNQLPPSLKHPVMTIGVFDGVHRGHQATLEQVVRRAREKSGTALVLTFDPHPQKTIAPDKAPLLLQTSPQKQRTIEQLGIDVLIQLPFTRRLSLFTPEEFVERILFNHGIREIFVGGNFRFGHRRSGDFETLSALGKRFGIDVFSVDPIEFRGAKISSTRIRELLKEGRASLARRLLGRPYHLIGTVVRGAGAGARLGFATANLQAENELTPGTGVYAGQALVLGKRIPSVTNIGYRPTLHEGAPDKPVIEAHLLDFEQDLYGVTLELELCLRLRSERKFPSIAHLQKQIEKDIRRTREYLTKVAPYREEISWP
jgi:riboflavin kinase / FMN adenylyltransferase